MPTPLTDAINALTTYANETTGASDTTLSAAVGTLVAGYGQGGGGGNIVSGTYTPTENTLHPTIEIGTSDFTNFLIFCETYVTGYGVKAFGGAFVQFVDGATTGTGRIWTTTNNGGTSSNGYTQYQVSSKFTKSGTTLTVPSNQGSGAYYGNFIGGKKYYWYAWSDGVGNIIDLSSTSLWEVGAVGGGTSGNYPSRKRASNARLRGAYLFWTGTQPYRFTMNWSSGEWEALFAQYNENGIGATQFTTTATSDIDLPTTYPFVAIVIRHQDTTTAVSLSDIETLKPKLIYIG